MTIKELMIGNWVLINGKPMQIEAIDDIDGEIVADGELYCLVEDREHSEDKIEGIPLTDEFFEYNGWKLEEDTYTNDFLGIWPDYEEYGLWLVGTLVKSFRKSYQSFCDIRYVHQYQNLFTAAGEMELSNVKINMGKHRKF